MGERPGEDVEQRAVGGSAPGEERPRVVAGGHEVAPDHLGQRADEHDHELLAPPGDVPVEARGPHAIEHRQGDVDGQPVGHRSRLELVRQRQREVALAPDVGEVLGAERAGGGIEEHVERVREQIGVLAPLAAPPRVEPGAGVDVGTQAGAQERDPGVLVDEQVAPAQAVLQRRHLGDACRVRRQERVGRRFTEGLPPHDAELLRSALPTADLATSVREALVRHEGYLRDAALTFRPWAFDVAAVTLPDHAAVRRLRPPSDDRRPVAAGADPARRPRRRPRGHAPGHAARFVARGARSPSRLTAMATPEFATLTTDDLVTGEAVALDLPPAGLGIRIASGLIDVASHADRLRGHDLRPADRRPADRRRP